MATYANAGETSVPEIAQHKKTGPGKTRPCFQFRSRRSYQPNPSSSSSWDSPLRN